MSGAVRGILQIRDGSPVPQDFKLDGSYLQAGIFIYARQAQGGRELVLDEPDGQQVREVASYLGSHPRPRPAAQPERPPAKPASGTGALAGCAISSGARRGHAHRTNIEPVQAGADGRVAFAELPGFRFVR